MANIQEDDDILVEEIPVFVSKNLLDQLYLFQYPTKTHITNFDNATVVNCCMKPVNQVVKVDFALNTESKFYDHFKGEQFAKAADGKAISKGERVTYKRGIMDKQSFVSSKSVEDVNRFVCGIYADKEIHLSSLTGILQFRPSFSHFDKEDKRTKNEKNPNAGDDEDEELQQVTVKFARSGPVAKKAKEKQGFDNFLKKSDNEPWCETFWYPRTSSNAEVERQKLYTSYRQASMAVAVDAPTYLGKLIASDGVDQGIDTVLPSRVVSKARLKFLPHSEQIKAVLTNGKMLSFDEIMAILQENVETNMDTEKVLRTLTEVAILIHGNWVPQSEILYPAETLSDANGVCSEQMIRARDYVLFQFSRHPFLYRRQVISATQLPPAETVEILRSVAHLNNEKKWELLLNPDLQFQQRYPDLVQRQEMVWRAREQTFNDMDNEKLSKRIRKRSIRESKPVPPLTPTQLQQEAVTTNAS